MKKVVVIILMLSIILATLYAVPLMASLVGSLVSTSLKRDDSRVYTIHEAYDYSLYTTDEWDYLNYDDRVKAIQIPEVVLKNMTTEMLFSSVMDYPFLFNMAMAPTRSLGFQIVYTEFPGIGELTARPDFGEILLMKYLEMSPITEDGKTNRALWALEIMITQPMFIQGLSSSDIIRLSEIVELKIIEKQETVNYNGPLYEFFHALRETPESPMWEVFNNDHPIWTDVEPLPSRKTAEDVRGGGSVSTTVQTPVGNPVKAKGWDSSKDNDYPLNHWEDYHNYISDAFKAATHVSGSYATDKYNCHSYAWYWQSTSNQKWMDDIAEGSSSPFGLKKYMTDGSYKQTTSIIFNGDIVFMANGGHSGIIINLGPSGGNASYDLSIQYRSKWGPYAIYECTIGYTPSFLLFGLSPTSVPRTYWY